MKTTRFFFERNRELKQKDKNVLKIWSCISNIGWFKKTKTKTKTMDKTETFRQVGPFEISNLCLETYPCQHYVRFQNGNTVRMGGADIHCLLKSNGLSDVHFDMYATYVKQRNSPDEIERQKTMQLSAEEFAKQIAKVEAAKQLAKEEAELQTIVSQTKASSRLLNS